MISLTISDAKMKFLLPIILFLPSIIISQNSQNIYQSYTKTVDKIISEAMTKRIGYKWLEELCQIGPRLSGSPQSFQAIRWAENKLMEIGCDSVWLQPVKVPRWVRGKTETAVIRNSSKHEGRNLSIAALGGSIGTFQGLSAKIIEVKSFEELSQRKNEARGKIIFFNVPFNDELINTFQGYGEIVKYRAYGAIEAAKYGAAGVIIRSITTKYDNTPHVGSMNYVDTLRHIPGVAIGLIDADFLSKTLKEEPELEVELNLSCITLSDVDSYNVIAEIKGTEFPNEIVMVSGHFDSWDKGCGAHDDGAGCVQSMEVLNIIKTLEIKPKRTLRCVLFMNEENGLRGALRYADISDSLREKHIAAIESDRGGFIPQGFSADSDDLSLSKMQNFLPLLNKVKIDWIKRGGSGADISRIKNADALIGYVPDDQRYFDVHHSGNDTFDTINSRELQLGTAAITILSFLISEEGL